MSKVCFLMLLIFSLVTSACSVNYDRRMFNIFNKQKSNNDSDSYESNVNLERSSPEIKNTPLKSDEQDVNYYQEEKGFSNAADYLNKIWQDEEELNTKIKELIDDIGLNKDGDLYKEINEEKKRCSKKIQSFTKSKNQEKIQKWKNEKEKLEYLLQLLDNRTESIEQTILLLLKDNGIDTFKDIKKDEKKIIEEVNNEILAEEKKVENYKQSGNIAKANEHEKTIKSLRKIKALLSELKNYKKFNVHAQESSDSETLYEPHSTQTPQDPEME